MYQLLRALLGSGSKPTTHPSKRSHWPELELLEDRTTPSVVSPVQRHHHPAQLEVGTAGKSRGQRRRHREGHPPRPVRRAGQRRRLGHREEALAAALGLHHEHGLAAHLGTPPPPSAGRR